MNSLLKIFNDIATGDPDAAAIVDMEGRRATSYGSLDDISGRIAAYLLKLKIGKENVVMINCGRGMEHIAARLGIMKAGAAFVCVEDMLGQERIEYIFMDSNAVLDFTLSHFDRAMEMPPLSKDKWSDTAEHDLAFITYTSGSTGNPKGAAQEYGIYDNIIKGTRPLIEDYLPAAFGNIIPESFVAGLHITVGALSSGAVLHEIPLALVKDHKGLLSYFEKHGINVTFMTPTLAKALFSAGGLKLSALHVGGEIASDIYTEDFDVKNVYSSTEINYTASAFKLDRPYDNAPVGRLLDGTRWLLIDEDRGVSERKGVLCVSLPYFRGYINHDNDNCFFTKDGIRYFITNDVVSSDKGVLTILGRDDEMIKLNGNRIEPSEIERAVKKVTGVDFAICRANVRGGVKFLSVYVPWGSGIDREKALTKLNRILPEYMLPSCFVEIKSLPKNNNGKVDKKALPEPDIKDILSIYASPENDLQRKLCRLFEEILELSDRRIGIDDSFFLLGGSSLLAMKLVIAADIPALTFRMIYENQTVRKIDSALKGLKAPGGYAAFPANGLQLTDMQRDFLEIQLKYPEIPLYNYGAVLEFKADTDPIKLKNAVNKAFNAHPGLSVTIKKDGEEWRQYMSDELTDVCTVTILSEKELEKKKESFLVPPCFDGSPMYRFSILKTPERLVLLADINHLICDGVSLRYFGEDIISVYEGRAAEPDDYLKAIGDILKREEERRKSLKESGSFKKAGDERIRLLCPDLPGNESVFGSAEREIGIEREKILKAAKKYGTSPGTLFMSAAALAFSRINETHKVLMSWISRGRDDIGTAKTVGMFIETFPVLFDLGNDPGKKKSISSVISDVSVQIRKTIGGEDVCPYLCNSDEKMTVFNYLGDLQKDTESDLLIDADYIDNGEIPSTEPFMIIIDDDEDEGTKIDIEYDAGLYLRSSVEKFIDLFLEELQRMITQHP